METLRINNGNLNEAQVVEDSLPRGEGSGTQDVSVEVLIQIEIEMEQYLEEKYFCFRNLLENESSRKEDYINEEESNNFNIPWFGFRIGPGKIGNNVNGKQKGFAGKSNLYMGVKDKRAEELAKKIEKIRAEETLKLDQERNNNCESKIN